jgi:hypothetical protein
VLYGMMTELGCHYDEIFLHRPSRTITPTSVGIHYSQLEGVTVAYFDLISIMASGRRYTVNRQRESAVELIERMRSQWVTLRYFCH